VIERLHAAGARAKIKAEIVHNIKDGRGGGDPKNMAIVNCGFDPSLAGKSVAELTKARGVNVNIDTASETAMGLQERAIARRFTMQSTKRISSESCARRIR